MNHSRFLLAFLVVLGCYGLSSGQDQQQPAQESQPQQPQHGVIYQPLAREWTGLIPGYQKPAGVEAQYGVMTEVRTSRNLRPSDAPLMTQAPVLGPDEKPLPGRLTAMPEAQTRPGRSIVTPSISPSSENAYGSPVTSSGAIHAPQRNPSKQVAQKTPGLGQTGVKPMREKPVSRNTPGSFNEYGAQLLTTLLPKPEPHDLILRCGVQGRSADVVTGRCM